MSIDFNDEQFENALLVIVIQLERSPVDCKLLQPRNASKPIDLHLFRLTDCKLLQNSNVPPPISSQLLKSMFFKEVQL